MKTQTLAVTLAMVPGLLLADRVTLRDGTSMQGTFVSGNGRTITFQDDQGVRRRLDVANIRTLDFDDNARGGAAGSGVFPSSGSSTARTSSSADRMSEREIPAGAEIAVRTNEAIESTTATGGRTFDAEVYKDVTDAGGRVIIPRGSDAQLVVRDLSAGGRTGSSELVLDLQTVNIGGQRYLISTEDVERSGREGIGANRRTATMVGGGAALGTLLGAIAGGGRGAAIGAIAGAAAGGAAQVLTRGKEVKVPAETVLTFRLDQPVQLQATR